MRSGWRSLDRDPIATRVGGVVDRVRDSGPVRRVRKRMRGATGDVEDRPLPYGSPFLAELHGSVTAQDDDHEIVIVMSVQVFRAPNCDGVMAAVGVPTNRDHTEILLGSERGLRDQSPEWEREPFRFVSEVRIEHRDGETIAWETGSRRSAKTPSAWRISTRTSPAPSSTR